MNKDTFLLFTLLNETHTYIYGDEIYMYVDNDSKLYKTLKDLNSYNLINDELRLSMFDYKELLEFNFSYDLIDIDLVLDYFKNILMFSSQNTYDILTKVLQHNTIKYKTFHRTESIHKPYIILIEG